MNLESVRELIQLMKENNIGEVDIESEGERVRLKTSDPSPAPPVYVAAPAIAAPPVVAAAPIQEMLVPPPAKEELKGTTIKSPIVGMFYRSPAPDKPPFVEIGDAIEEGTVLCIIEAMKVMNEIKAEMSGALLKILVEPGQPVEFGQPLFLIDPAG